MVINPRTFSSINITNNTITISNHKYYTGQKVLYTSNTPATGLINNNFYYIIVIDSNNVRLSNSYYNATKNNPEEIDILSSTSGTLSPINPPLQVVKNQQITFDLSDTSLSFVSVGNTYSAFDFKIYKDSKFTEEFNTTQSSSTFDVVKTGQIGVDTNAKLTLIVNDQTPNNLYYKLVPTNLSLNSQVKKEIIIDSDVVSSNKISIVENGYNGKHTIVGIASTYFQFNILDRPQFELLVENSSSLEYYTDTLSVKGEIQEISITDKGKGYDTLPSIISVSSKSGSGSILVPISNSICLLYTS